MHELDIPINLKIMSQLCGTRSASIEETQWHRQQIAAIVFANYYTFLKPTLSMFKKHSFYAS